MPDVKWDDVGALGDLREELTMSILQPINNPAQFQSIGALYTLVARFSR